eukprot:CAMPEP_0194418552 /NCGR_PEP_ID=MMETSP0176-20130528/17704_1 /TAXON_ID=216777 /ORGANISM="Proboscia alata, Strain PI-D3" /LENGTH=63 /DNA_ID=CAMNT_0039225091 /DNA_START=134 /DNA_END=322 /DNA_ORIENTATION=+
MNIKPAHAPAFVSSSNLYYIDKNKRGIREGVVIGGGGNRGSNYGLSLPHSFMLDDQDENDYHH